MHYKRVSPSEITKTVKFLDHVFFISQSICIAKITFLKLGLTTCATFVSRPTTNFSYIEICILVLSLNKNKLLTSTRPTEILVNAISSIGKKVQVTV